MVSLRWVFCSLLALSLCSAQAQKVDYLDIKDSLTYLSCFQASPDTIELSLENLLAVDISSIDTNLSHYYYDLGWAYFFKAAYTKDQSWKDLSDLAYYKCYTLDSNYVSSIWNLALRYSNTGECELSKVLIQEYLKRCPKEYIRQGEVDMIIERCN